MKVGDYVRTRDGIISKIEDNFNTTMCISTDRGKYHYEYFDIIKSSPNIIDLIEVGDYVNGNKIIKICDDFAGRKILVYGYDNGERQVAITIYEEDIKSIVTKEQFEAMKYEIK